MEGLGHPALFLPDQRGRIKLPSMKEPDAECQKLKSTRLEESSRKPFHLSQADQEILCASPIKPAPAPEPMYTAIERSSSPIQQASIDVTSQQLTTDFRQSCSNCSTITTPLWRRSPEGRLLCNACGLCQKTKKTRNATRPNSSRQNIPVSPPQAQTQCNSRSPSLPFVQTIQPPRDTLSLPVPEQLNGSFPDGVGGHIGVPAGDHPSKPYGQKLFAIETTEQTDISMQRPSFSSQYYSGGCINCGTNKTTLWRRDKAGYPMCNACSLYLKFHGHQRPKEMKSVSIGRRKRVKPAHSARISQSDTNLERALSDIARLVAYQEHGEQQEASILLHEQQTLGRPVAQTRTGLVRHHSTTVPMAVCQQDTIECAAREGKAEKKARLMRDIDAIRKALRVMEKKVQELN